MSVKRTASLDEDVVAAPQEASKRRGEKLLLPSPVKPLEWARLCLGEFRLLGGIAGDGR